MQNSLIRSSLLVIAILATASTANAGIAEQNVRDAANGLVAPPALSTTCDPVAFRPNQYHSMGAGEGLATAGFGLASLAIASMISSRKHADALLKSPCVTKPGVASNGTDPLAMQLTPSQFPSKSFNRVQ
ncbi:hypothetical protein [Burkholderia sp. 22PA0106]|uniref:hypothetical protein n=1 Tax=Burkholderia sp. 22PA0106 TaxID=3237371 RepID=UPI0039C07003